jgi:N6-adenosine-specific RNA methylase IME4
MVWVKDKIGMGHLVRQRHELLLIGKRGNMPTPETSARPDSVVEAPRGEHSVKPEIFYELIQAMYPGRRYGELFARRPRDGWASWGNEVAAFKDTQP